MKIELTPELGNKLRSPNMSVLAGLHLALSEEFLIQGLRLHPDPDFGDIVGGEYFGYSVDDEAKGVALGFLQIMFEPNGWTALAPQTELGKRSLTALAKAIGRDSENLDLEKVTIQYAMYVTHFPFKTAPTSH
jgi:hypothetical protein